MSHAFLHANCAGILLLIRAQLNMSGMTHQAFFSDLHGSHHRMHCITTSHAVLHALQCKAGRVRSAAQRSTAHRRHPVASFSASVLPGPAHLVLGQQPAYTGMHSLR